MRHGQVHIFSAEKCVVFFYFKHLMGISSEIKDFSFGWHVVVDEIANNDDY